MTPEERFTKIENFLAAISEHQAGFDERQAKFDERQASFDEHHARFDERQARLLDENQARFDEHEARMAVYQLRHEEHLARHDHEIGEIRGFEKETRIAILAVIDAQDTVAEVLKSLAETQQAGEEKLKVLIETIDRITRGPDNQSA